MQVVDMVQDFVNSKTIKIIYGVIFPIIVITLLLGIASINNRPMLLGSPTSDFILRFIISIWFCVLYIRLSRFSSYRLYPNIKWTKADVGSTEKYFLIGGTIFFSSVCGLITYLVFQWFLPGISNWALVIAAANGLVTLLPMVTQYWVLKL